MQTLKCEAIYFLFICLFFDPSWLFCALFHCLGACNVVVWQLFNRFFPSSLSQKRCPFGWFSVKEKKFLFQNNNFFFLPLIDHVNNIWNKIWRKSKNNLNNRRRKKEPKSSKSSEIPIMNSIIAGKKQKQRFAIVHHEIIF